jgi:hypothetical protein
MQAELPVMRKQARVGTSVLHVFALASEVSRQCFNADVKSFASASPSWAPLPPGIADESESWYVWRAMISSEGKDESFAHVHVGPDRALVVLAATTKRAQASMWLHKEEILGAHVEHAASARPSVMVSLLTVPTGSPESSESRHEVFRMSSFQDAAHAELSGEAQRGAATACGAALELLARLSAPLHRENLHGTRAGHRLHVLVNPCSGHKAGARIWASVEPLLVAASVDFSVTATEYAGTPPARLFYVSACATHDGVIAFRPRADSASRVRNT